MRIARLPTQTTTLRAVFPLYTVTPTTVLQKPRRLYSPSFVYHDARPRFRRIFCTSSTKHESQHVDPTRDKLPLGSSRDNNISDKSPTADTTDGGSSKVLPAVKERKNLNAWLRALDSFLPKHLRLQTAGDDVPARQDVVEIFRLLAVARATQFAGVDLLAYMIISQGRHKAVLYIVDHLVKLVASQSSNDDLSDPPSNIEWPQDPLWYVCRKPLNVSNFSPHRGRQMDVEAEGASDARYFNNTPDIESRRMEQIWLFLGRLIIDASNLSGEQAQQTMSTVYKILAQIHSLDLLPDNVYSYSPSPYSTTVRQPPIIHLLSSRILTTLSDAVWRSHQDDVISQAVSKGVPYEKLGLDPPGGRFRLKVRELGPEVWLEFVLWCCVEGGFASAAARIVDHLKYQTGEPWFAISWTSRSGSQGAVAEVDWNRVRSRHGGSVGLVEGYSGEKPLAEMPPRTISAEVILAITEVLLNSVNVGVPGKGISSLRAQKDIKHMIAFLEPHNLPTDYFDYLTVRLLQTGALDVDRRPDSLYAWSRTMTHLRSLESVESQAPVKIGFDYDVVLAHCELQAGILHQALLAYIYACDVSQSLETFAEIQQLVDSSKLQAIGAFLNQGKSKSDGFFSAKPNRMGADFIHSHGQLPLYRTATFLNLVTDNNLVRFGDWLLYTADVDGPVIPRSAYAQSCMATALTRFAVAANDKQTIPEILAMRRRSKLKPSVNFLRALIDAQICLCEFGDATELLKRLAVAQAGGYSPNNLANLGATILRLEQEGREAGNIRVAERLAESRSLMEELLGDRYPGRGGVFHQRQKKLFRNQVGHILRIFENISSNALNDIAFSHKDRYPASNEASLPSHTFNILLTAIVDTGGAFEGRRIWNLFCEDPRTVPIDWLPLQNDYAVSGEIYDEQIEAQGSREQSSPSMEEPDSAIPFDYDSLITMRSEAEISAQPPKHDDAGVLPNPPLSTLANIHFDSGMALPGSGSGWLDMIATPNQTNSGSPAVMNLDLAPLNPLVIPDIRTLRIIVKSALKEIRTKVPRRTRQERGNREAAQRVIRWASHYYEAFGSSKRSIEQEINEPMLDAENLPPVDWTTDYVEHRQSLDFREARPLSIKRHFSFVKS